MTLWFLVLCNTELPDDTLGVRTKKTKMTKMVGVGRINGKQSSQLKNAFHILIVS